MVDTDEQSKLFSFHLNNVLDFVGASEYVRRTQHHGSTVQELVLSVSQNITESPLVSSYTYKFGSGVEGTTTPGLRSDFDTLICVDQPKIVETISSTDVEECLLMFTDESTPPGYTKLKKVMRKDSRQVEKIQIVGHDEEKESRQIESGQIVGHDDEEKDSRQIESGQIVGHDAEKDSRQKESGQILGHDEVKDSRQIESGQIVGHNEEKDSRQIESRQNVGHDEVKDSRQIERGQIIGHDEEKDSRQIESGQIVGHDDEEKDSRQIEIVQIVGHDEEKVSRKIESRQIDDEEKDSMGNVVVLNRYLIEQMTNDEINGPAGTTLKNENLPGVPDLDFVPAYRCRTWPSQAQSWLTRNRPSGFPDNEMVQRFTQYGCFLVPVGHHASKEKHLQWRLSFSCQERQIMFGLNPTQFKTYIALKMIKNDFIKPYVPPKSLTSYHCKTCLFYVLETYSVKLWIPENLVKCISRCLQKLLEWFEDGFLPNYFISEENMWKGNNETCDMIIQIIRSHLDATPRYLTDIKCDSVGLFLQHDVTCEKSISDVSELPAEIKVKVERSQHELDRFIYKIHMWTIDYIIKCAKEVIIFAADKSLDDCIDQHNEFICRMVMDSDPRLLLEHIDLERQMASEYILPFLYTSLGSQLIVKHLKSNNKDDKASTLNEAFEILRKGLECDSVSGRLKLAVVLFKTGRLMESKDNLDKIDENLDSQILTTHCGCSKEVDYVCRDLQNRIRNEKLSTLEILRENIGACVWFLRTEIDLVPKDLQYEMFRSACSQTTRKPHVDDWFDCAAVDADVFLFYIQYKVNQALGYSNAMALIQLTAVTEQNTNLTHYDTAHNLLGCLLKEWGKVEEAWHCFLASWLFRPDHNAAKWHMAVMLFKTVQNQSF